MPRLPYLQEHTTYRELTDVFAGYNHNLKIGDGEFFDTQNLTTLYYPVMANRKKRGWVKDLFSPGGIMDKVYLAYVDEGTLYLNDRPTNLSGLSDGWKQLVPFGAYICVFPDGKYYNTADPDDWGSFNFSFPNEKWELPSGYSEMFRFTKSETLNCDFYPYYETPEDTDDYYYAWLGVGNKASGVTNEEMLKLWDELKEGDQILLPEAMTKLDATYEDDENFDGEWVRRNRVTIVKKNPFGASNMHLYATQGVSYTWGKEPEIPVRIVQASPASGEGIENESCSIWSARNTVWYNGTVGATQYHLPMPYNRDMSARIIPTTVTRVEVDGVRRTSGWSYNPQTGILTFQTSPYPSSAPTEDNTVRITYLIDVPGWGQDILVAIPKKSKRNGHYATALQQDNVPEMDFVIECKNRLWGCKYGMVDNEMINEIYCCELGNFKNWRRFEGLSTDPYAASVGSDGPWTGAINYIGYPTFFKEDRIHRVAVSATGAHEITEIVCEGVQNGSSRSLAIINGLLYYKSNRGVCVYQGGVSPSIITDALGDEHYTDAAAGVDGQNYYISMKDSSGNWNLFCYDSRRGLWMREDNLDVRQFATVGEELYALTESKQLWALKGSTGQAEEHVDWYGESGLMYYQYPDKKYISRFNFRLTMERGTRLRVFLEYDSSDRWEKMGEIIADRPGSDTKTVTLPIVPRRCDHLRIRIEGRGNCKIYSVARILAIGSDY